MAGDVVMEGKIPGDPVDAPTGSTRDWHPGANALAAMNLAGLVILVVSALLYLALWTARSGEASVEISGREALIGIGVALILTLVLMVLHELVHGLVIRLFGGRPSYGMTMLSRVTPAFYCTAPGARFTRGQFIGIAAAPFLVLGVATALVVAFAPMGGWLVLPAAVHAAGCIGDFVMILIVLRQPSGTLVEDMKSGMRFHDAPGHPAS